MSPSRPPLVGGRGRKEPAPRREPRGKDPDQIRFYGSPQWKRLRAAIRADQPICKLCGRRPSQAVDHINGDWTDNRSENLQGICFPCHTEKSGREHQAKQHGTGTGRFVILVGPAGVGKTSIRVHLAKMLKAVSLGPDDFGGDWKEVYGILDNATPAVVECCVASGSLLRRADERGAYVVEVALDEEARRRRLVARGEIPERVAMFMAEPKRLGYERSVVPDLTVDAALDPESNARRIADAYLCGGGRV